MEDIVESSSLAGAMNALWDRFLPEMESRVAVLESAAEAMRAGHLLSGLRDDAHAAAHKLAGVLGTFGLTQGTLLARELETMYSQEDGRLSLDAERLTEMAAELRGIVTGRK